DHKRYRMIRKKLAEYDWQGFMVELNSAVGTFENEKKEERLKELLAQLSQYPEASGDYRDILHERGINTDDFRPTGSAEGTMSVVARRLKNGRSWCRDGRDRFIDVMVGLKDNLEIKTVQAQLEQSLEGQKKNLAKRPPKRFVEKLKD